MTTVDCDGISHNFFAFLARDNRRMESARVFIPATVAFDQGFASAWYTSTANMEVKKRNVKNINAAEIYKEFSVTHHPNADIVAMFLTSSKSYFVDEVKPGTTETIYFTKDSLYDFLFSPGQKPRGILQKFEYPKGWCSTTIQATWAPNVCITEAIRNPNSLYDKTKPIAERAGSHECGLAHQVSITNSVTMAVRQLCAIVVQHFQQVDHVELCRMVLHFKVDRHNRVLLLYSTSLRTASSSLGVKNSNILPVNLIHRFAGEAEQRTMELNKLIDEMKRSQVTKINDPGVQLHHHSFAASSIYKGAAAKIIELESRKRKSNLVTPALLSQVAHNGRRWVPLPLSPVVVRPLQIHKEGRRPQGIEPIRPLRAMTVEPELREEGVQSPHSLRSIVRDLGGIIVENPREEVRSAIEEVMYELTSQDIFRSDVQVYPCRFSKHVVEVANGLDKFLSLFGTLSVRLMEADSDTDLYPSGAEADGAIGLEIIITPKTWSADVALCRSNVCFFCCSNSPLPRPIGKDDAPVAPSWQMKHSDEF